MRHALVVLFPFIFGAPAPSLADSNVNAKIVIHLATPTTKNSCIREAAHPSCSSIVASGDLYPARYFAYVLVTDVESCAGLSGVQFGIEYTLGVQIFEWNGCGDQGLYTPFWPEPGSGAKIVWNSAVRCQRDEPGGPGTGVVATAGFFYMAAYAPDRLSIGVHPQDGRAAITNCASEARILYGGGIPLEPSPLGHAAFSAGAEDPGYSPCGVVFHPAACAIAGPDYQVPGTIVNYTIDSDGCRENMAWSLEGNAAIVGSSDEASVSVRAGTAPDPFTLNVTFTAGGETVSCSKTVEVAGLAPLDCSILGSASVAPGSTTHYEAPINAGVSYLWTVAGNGSIVGAADGRDVLVLAGMVGAFDLHLRVSRGTDFEECLKTVSVAIPQVTCSIQGPDEVIEGPAAALFFLLGGGTWAWSVSGNATIAGRADTLYVEVVPGEASGGPFTVSVVNVQPNAIRSCSKTVSVIDVPPSGPGRNANAKILVHIVSNMVEHPCLTSRTAPACRDISVRGKLYPPNLYYAVLLVTDGATDGSPYSGIGGARFGIDYNGANQAGVDIFAFTFCGYLELHTPAWPAPGSGIRVSWDPMTTCQRSEPGGAGSGVVARIGYFYMGAYSPDVLRVTPYPEDGEARVLDCAGYESVLRTSGPGSSPLGFAEFSLNGDQGGYNPCGLVIPVRPTTWSAIKSMYE